MDQKTYQRETRAHGPRRRVHGEDGFTMIELMVVIVILGMLAALVGVNVMGNLERGYRSTAKTQINSLKSALFSYKLDFKKYPSDLNGLISNAKNKRYLLDAEKIPKDPWGNDYVYRSPGGNGRDYDLVAYGKDGSPGGTDDDADVESWNLQGDV